ncbi:RdgB/HAM1 family non-canonical purine NTP pyrophosphatase [Allobaculum sp. JKK-2023]|uniref:RdgB/HAM1 family non-canonical purine NTP pyrophosphatase n=1 Tax=Allobaculum sp. JKK-2023 TaxID=3108943 RepID=UPI002B056BCB|nr:RdgB/HAM1 family non-canonical purine NTP pyrophosphatase [Allobaculum sp. JKK-2023]
MKKVWIATGNTHKKDEFAAMLSDDVQVLTLKDLEPGLEPEINEDGKTFEENALIKARALHNIVHEAVMSDDSGLEVDALDKKPGIYSARFMGEDTSYEIKNQAILDALKDRDDRTARFVCAIAWIEEDGTEHVYRGTMEGEINDKIEGANGFGYDPIFYYPPFKTTSANVAPEVKNSASHRHNALMQLMKDWKNL